MIAIPAEFAAGLIAEHGEPARAWLAKLPKLVGTLCHDWGLVVDGEPRHGHLGLVVPVQRGAEPCVLKVSWPDAATVHEARALAVWNGGGAVQLRATDHERSALLLDRLDPDRSLHSLPLDSAMTVAGNLVRVLSIPGDPTVPTVASLADDIAASLLTRWERLARPIPLPAVERAIILATDLPRGATDAAARMVNWDLHFGNVLWSPSRQEWVTIDPKPALGPPEFGIAQLLWTRFDNITGPADLRRHLATLTDAGGLDPALTTAWTRVRVVDFWLWALGIGLTEVPRSCATLLDWLDRGD